MPAAPESTTFLPGIWMPRPTKPSPPCGGDAREAVKALIVANDFLGAQVEELRAAVSTGYSRDRYDLPRDRKDWYD